MRTEIIGEIESILSDKSSDPKETSSDLKVASIIKFSASVGLAILGIILAKLDHLLFKWLKK